MFWKVPQASYDKLLITGATGFLGQQVTKELGK